MWPNDTETTKMINKLITHLKISNKGLDLINLGIFFRNKCVLRNKTHFHFKRYQFFFTPLPTSLHPKHLTTKVYSKMHLIAHAFCYAPAWRVITGDPLITDNVSNQQLFQNGPKYCEECKFFFNWDHNVKLVIDVVEVYAPVG